MEFDRSQRVINIQGLQQTSYADWSRAVLLHYPYNPKFQKNGSKVLVFVDNVKVAYFDFETGTGGVLYSRDGEKPINATGQFPNFEKFNIDNYIQQ